MKAALLGPRRLAGSVSAMVVWAAWFVVVYALNGIGCDAGWQQRAVPGGNLLSALLLATSGIALSLIGWIGWRGYRGWHRHAQAAAPGGRSPEQAPFTSLMMLALAVVAAVGTLMTTIPIVMLSPCAA